MSFTEEYFKRKLIDLLNYLNHNDSLIDQIEKQGMPTLVYLSGQLEDEQTTEFFNSIGIRCLYSEAIPINVFFFQWNCEMEYPFDRNWYNG